jgi:hypothetical protein
MIAFKPKLNHRHSRKRLKYWDNAIEGVLDDAAVDLVSVNQILVLAV